MPSSRLPAGAPTRERQAGDLPAEGYRLVVGEHRVDLAFADEAGLRYGRQTLEQLRDGSRGALPACRIEDAPDLPVRGYMLDVSRDRVPSRETLEWLVRRLAALRYNHLQLYTEHSFAYRDHEPVWRDASPMTAADVRWLDDLCAEQGVELAANQNTFGHMERWLRHEPYRSRAETPEGWQQNGRTRAPTALAPTPENAEFALGLVRELAACVRSRRINIGCDEVWELGRGVSADACEARGRPAVFVEHLRRIAGPLLEEGFEVQFWADMVQKVPELGRPLAEAGAIAAIWGYEAPLPIDPSQIDYEAMPADIRDAARDYLETAARGFGPRLESFAKMGFRTWVVPGTSGWNSFVGRHRNARGNLLDAVESGLAHGAEGILVTEWGDNGHMQPPFATFPALAYGGATAWCRATNGDLDDAALAMASSRLLGDPSGRLGRALVRLGGVADELGLLQANGTPFFHELVPSGFRPSPDAPDPAAWARALAAIEEALSELDGALPRGGDGDLLLRETRQSAALARHGLRRIALRHGMGGVEDAPPEEVLPALVREQRACWLARSRPGGLDDSVERLR